MADYGADPTTVITAVLHDLEDVSTQDAAEGLTHDTALRTTFGAAMVDLLSEVMALSDPVRSCLSTPPITEPWPSK